MEGYKSTVELADALKVTQQTVLNWVRNEWIKPALIDNAGQAKFSDEQYYGMIDKLPLPKHGKDRIEWLAEFMPKDVVIMPRANTSGERPLLPTRHGPTYPDDPKERNKISEIVAKSNKLLMASLSRRTDIYNVECLIDDTKEYFEFCELEGCMPSFRRLCNWFGYSLRHMETVIREDTPTGRYLTLIKDAIQDNYEQAGLKNSCNSIFAMFLLKSQYGYVETQKQVIEHTNPLGTPKSADEIASVIDAEFFETE